MARRGVIDACAELAWPRLTFPPPVRLGELPRDRPVVLRRVRLPLIGKTHRRELDRVENVAEVELRDLRDRLVRQPAESPTCGSDRPRAGPSR